MSSLGEAVSEVLDRGSRQRRPVRDLLEGEENAPGREYRVRSPTNSERLNRAPWRSCDRGRSRFIFCCGNGGGLRPGDCYRSSRCTVCQGSADYRGRLSGKLLTSCCVKGGFVRIVITGITKIRCSGWCRFGRCRLLVRVGRIGVVEVVNRKDRGSVTTRNHRVIFLSRTSSCFVDSWMLPSMSIDGR